MPVVPAAAEAITLHTDLLEASERIYHRHVAVIQQVFCDQYLKVLRQHIAGARLGYPDVDPALLESWAREGLRAYRAELRRKQGELIAHERRRREERDRGIRAYISSRATHPLPAA